MAGHYVKLTIPKADAERLYELAKHGFIMLAAGKTLAERTRDMGIVTRIKTAIGGKDMRATNRHNTHESRPKGKRMGYLDVSRKPAA